MKLRHVLLNVATVLALLMPFGATIGTASAAGSPCGNTAAAQQVLTGIGKTGSTCGDKRITGVFKTIVQILSILVGITSIIMILFGGFKYITSGGESGRVSNAKSTVLYAVVGLAVAALAQLMIHFVLFQTTKAGS